MPVIGYQLNNKHSEKYCLAIGKLMVNFSAMELWTYDIHEEINGKKAYLDLLDHLFGKRCDMILKSAKGALDKKLFEELSGIISQAKELATFRNKIAHNPVVIVWKGGKPSDKAPDYIGLVDVKSMKGSKMPTVSLSEINEKVDEVVSLHRKAAKFKETLRENG